MPRGAQLTGGRTRIHTCVCLTAAPCSVLTLCDQHKDSLMKPLGLLVSSRAVEHGWAYPISYWQNPAHMQTSHPSSVVRGWMAGRGHRVTTGGGTFLNPGLTLLLSVRGGHGFDKLHLPGHGDCYYFILYEKVTVTIHIFKMWSHISANRAASCFNCSLFHFMTTT